MNPYIRGIGGVYSTDHRHRNGLGADGHYHDVLDLQGADHQHVPWHLDQAGAKEIYDRREQSQGFHEIALRLFPEAGEEWLSYVSRETPSLKLWMPIRHGQLVEHSATYTNIQGDFEVVVCWLGRQLKPIRMMERWPQRFHSPDHLFRDSAAVWSGDGSIGLIDHPDPEFDPTPQPCCYVMVGADLYVNGGDKVARDNTVKYKLRTLQLLPAQNRPSYAGVKVEVLEGSDGQLMVQYGGEVIPHLEAPPKAGVLRAAQGALVPTPELAQVVRNLSQHRLTRKQLQHLAALGTPADQPADQPMDDENRPTPYTPPPREATPRKQALWTAVHHAKLQGVPQRGIASQLGISRNTVRKYVDFPAPPINRTPRRSTQSVSQHNSNGHFP